MVSKKYAPKTSVKDEHKFIMNVMKNKKPEERIVHHIEDVEQKIKKDIEIRKIIPYISIDKTTTLLKNGFQSFVEFEQTIREDFFFYWLPTHIKKYIKLIIPLLLMGLILISDFGLEPDIKKALALFVCVSLLWAFESINIVVTALLIPVFAVILGLENQSNPFAAFSNPIIYLLLSGLILAQAFRKHNLDRLIAIKVLALSNGKIRKLLFLTMLTTAILGMWMSNTATIALLIPVILSVSKEISTKLNKNYTSMLLLSSGFSSAIGGLTTILGGNPNAITAAFLQNVSEFSFLDWTVIGFPISITLFIVSYFIFLRLYAVKNERIKIDTIKQEAKKTFLNRDQIKVLGVFVPTLFLWLFGSKIGINALKRTEIIGLSAAIILFAFKILDWEDVRRIPWEIFLIVGGGLTLGQILIDTGSASFMANKLIGVLSSIPTFLLLLVIIYMAILFANFVNNSSTTIILVPVLINLSPLLGINQKLIAMTVAMATAISPWTPIAIPAFSLIYGTGKVSRKEMIRTGMSAAFILAPVLAGAVYLFHVIG